MLHVPEAAWLAFLSELILNAVVVNAVDTCRSEFKALVVLAWIDGAVLAILFVVFTVVSTTLRWTFISYLEFPEQLHVYTPLSEGCTFLMTNIQSRVLFCSIWYLSVVGKIRQFSEMSPIFSLVQLTFVTSGVRKHGSFAVSPRTTVIEEKLTSSFDDKLPTAM